MARPLPPRETAQNRRNQFGAPLRYCARNRKRKAETTTTEPIDPDLWLQPPHAAVSWFTNIHRTSEPTQEEHTSKQRCLGDATTWWEHYLSSSNKLAMQHAQLAREIYCAAHATETAQRHLQELHTVYTNTLTSKTKYHLSASYKPAEGTHRGIAIAQHLYNNVSGTPTMTQPGKAQHHETVRRHKNISPLIREV